MASMLNWLQFGGVGEWLKPPDCKSGARKGFVGSNPTPSTTTQQIYVTGPHSSEVEHVLGKNGVGGSTPPVGSSASKIEELKWQSKDSTEPSPTSMWAP